MCVQYKVFLPLSTCLPFPYWYASPPPTALPSFLCCLFLPLLIIPFFSLFHTLSPPICILRGCLRPYIRFPQLLELPCVGNSKYLDFTCSPSPQASGAKADVWLKSWASYGVATANRLHHGLRTAECLTGACQQHLGHLCPPHSTMPSPFITYVTWRGQVFTSQPGDKEKCQLLFLWFGLLQDTFD